MLFRNAFHIFPFSNIHFISVPPYVPLYFALCCAAVATLLHSISPIKLMWSIVIKLHLVSLLIAHFTLFVWFGVSVCARATLFNIFIYYGMFFHIKFTCTTNNRTPLQYLLISFVVPFFPTILRIFINQIIF